MPSAKHRRTPHEAGPDRSAIPGSGPGTAAEYAQPAQVGHDSRALDRPLREYLALPAGPVVWDTGDMATPIEQAPPRVGAASAAHAGDRGPQRAEAAELLERHRAGETGIATGLEELLAALGLDQDPPGAAPAV
jgi:hypothetical protein